MRQQFFKWLFFLLVLLGGLTTHLFAVNSIAEETIYVSPKGDDHAQGTKKSPVQSLARAIEIRRSLRKTTPGKVISITMKGGIYPIESALLLSAEDGGTDVNPFVIQADGTDRPILLGSKPLKNWRRIGTDEPPTSLRQEVRSKVFTANLKELEIISYGDPIAPGQRPELFCDGQLQTLARWPNVGFTRAGLVKGATELPKTYQKVRGTREGVFEYTDQRQDQWASEKEACLGGYWYWDWSDQFQRVKNVDVAAHTLVLAEPYHHYGFKDSLRYFGVNLLCELDQPGEWFLDRSTGLVYWYPPKGIHPAKAHVTLSLFQAPYMVELNQCSYVILRGLGFEEGRGSALSISGGENCRIEDCRIERFGKDGIHIEEGHGHGISGCLIRTLGYRGIQIKGGDRKRLTPANHFVENTVVEYFALFQRTYEPAIYLDGCGIRISNNRFAHSSSSAMRLEGNDFTIEYNEVSEVVNESDDQGAVDIFYNPSYRGIKINHNYWSDIHGGTHNGAAGVRLDDMISGVTISGNIFERCGAVAFGGVQIHGGKDNVVDNNLFINCLAAVSFSRWGEKRWLEQLDSPEIRKKLFEEVDISSPLYQSRYPELKQLREKADCNTVKNNLIVGCQTQFLRIKEGVQVLENNTVLPSEGKGAAYYCAPERCRQYGMQPIPLGKIGPQNNIWIK